MRRIPQKVAPIAASLAILSCVPIATLADPPPGYYDTVNATNSTTLRNTLHAVIDDHTRIRYPVGPQTDTWDVLELADEDPNNSGNILDVYKNASYEKFGGGNDFYNREHTWPKSYGFPDDGADNYPYSDCHALFFSDDSYNFSRGNTAYRNCDAACEELLTDENNGQGGGEGQYPGNSNWRQGVGADGAWETWIGRRGDVARALFYMDVRYEGGIHGETEHDEPDLILTDNQDLILADSQNNQPVAYMGLLSVLLQWHEQDPVDEVEQHRNDVVFSFQENRNPFIDHPGWVACLFLEECDPTCQQDVNGDGLVGPVDLAFLLNDWGPCEGCPTDFNGDGIIGPLDLARLLGAWGGCP